MTQILRTTKNLPKETLSYEPFVDRTAQGKPNYGSATSFRANVTEYDVAGRGNSRGAAFVNQSTGSQINIPLTLYVQGDATNVPSVQDRVTRNGRRFIVAELTPVSGLDYGPSEPDHYRLRLREE